MVTLILQGRRRALLAIAAACCMVLLPAMAATGQAFASAGHSTSGPAVPGAQLWLSRYDGAPGGFDSAASVAVSPGGGTVFVTGGSMSAGFPSDYDYDYATVAYDAVTGAQLWGSRYNGPGNGDDIAASVAVSPDGATVFVTGSSLGLTHSADYATIAYNAVTGAQLWASRYNGPGNGDDHAVSVAVSPGGGMVFVTGGSPGTRSGRDYATVAYSATTGAQAWVRRYNGHGSGDDAARAVAVSPDGATVFVTGGSTSTGAVTGDDYVTIAYSAATGARRWLSRYNGPASLKDYAHSLVVGAGGREVIVTGASHSRRSGVDYATVAYSAATGAQLWARRYNGPGNNTDEPESVAAGPGGHEIYVTGHSQGATSRQDYATIAYDATTGTRRWVSRYNGPANADDFASWVTAGPGGREVFVTGFSTGADSGADYATVAYSAATGAQLWARRHNGTDNNQDFASSVAAGPDGTVFVTGGSDNTGPDGASDDYVTIAYKD